MISYREALLSVLDSKINPLTELKGKLRKLDQELETLNSMKEDTELKLGGLERPGRRRKGQVEKWVKDVERIKEKRQDMVNQINEICTIESSDEVCEEVLKDVENLGSERPSDDRGNISGGETMVGVKQMIGIRGTNIYQTDSPTTIHIENIYNCSRTLGHVANGEGKA